MYKLIIALSCVIFCLPAGAQHPKMVNGKLFTVIGRAGTAVTIKLSLFRQDSSVALQEMSANQIQAINDCMAHVKKKKYHPKKITGIDAAFKVCDSTTCQYMILTRYYGIIDISNGGGYRLSKEDYKRLKELF